MAHSYHHAVSSARKWGGKPDDYQAVHDYLDGSKQIIADFRHRALRHHAEGCFAAETIFGVTITNSDGRAVPVRLIAEQHIMEDLGRIPSFADWVRCIRPEPWMGRVGAHIDSATDSRARIAEEVSQPSSSGPIAPSWNALMGQPAGGIHMMPSGPAPVCPGSASVSIDTRRPNGCRPKGHPDTPRSTSRSE